MSDGHDQTYTIDGASLATRRWGSGLAGIVLLHDGLGSITQWRGVPAALAEATGRTVLAYDRAGHGRSRPVPTGPWPPDWLAAEAAVLARLLERVADEPPVLVGHSDGGSIALLHAAAAGRGVAGVVALAAHSYVEACCSGLIADLRRRRGPIVAGLARHHAAPEAVFEAWSGVWVSQAFQAWDIRPRLAAITAPTLVVQGEADEYATAEMVHATVAAIGANATGRFLPGVRHLLHHDAPEVVVELVSSFVAGLGAGAASGRRPTGGPG